MAYLTGRMQPSTQNNVCYELLRGVHNSIGCAFAEHSRFTDWPGVQEVDGQTTEGNHLTILLLAWAYSVHLEQSDLFLGILDAVLGAFRFPGLTWPFLGPWKLGSMTYLTKITSISIESRPSDVTAKSPEAIRPAFDPEMCDS
jgi:hypothetical protein